MIRHIRDTLESKPKVLKGVCKEQAEKPEEIDHEGQEEEGEEEDELTDDEEVTPGAESSSPNPSTSSKSTPPKQASTHALPSTEPTPCRRFSQIEDDDVQILFSGKSRDREELGGLLKKIAALELSKSGPCNNCF